MAWFIGACACEGLVCPKEHLCQQGMLQHLSLLGPQLYSQA